MLWGKSRHWCIIRPSHQVLLHIVDSLLPPIIYATPCKSLCIYLSVSISCRSGFIIGRWNSILIDFMVISQKIIYTLSSSFTNKSIWTSDPIIVSPLSPFSSLYYNTRVSPTSLMNITHLWTQQNSWYPKSSCFMKRRPAPFWWLLWPLSG